MIQKSETCLYCGEKMDSITAKKRFCSDLHRVYWNREQKAKKVKSEVVKKDLPDISVDNLNNKTGVIEAKKPLGSEVSNFVINTSPEKKASELTSFEILRNKRLGIK